MTFLSENEQRFNVASIMKEIRQIFNLQTRYLARKSLVFFLKKCFVHQGVHVMSCEG